MIEYQVKVYGNRTEWRLNGKLHREDGPAIEWSNSHKEWWVNDQRHREDGPAVEYSNGGPWCKIWWVHGQLHREDGPAVEYANGYKEWWVNDQRLTEEKFNNRTKSCAGKVIEIDGKKYKLTEL